MLGLQMPFKIHVPLATYGELCAIQQGRLKTSDRVDIVCVHEITAVNEEEPGQLQIPQCGAGLKGLLFRVDLAEQVHGLDVENLVGEQEMGTARHIPEPDFLPRCPNRCDVRNRLIQKHPCLGQFRRLGRALCRGSVGLGVAGVGVAQEKIVLPLNPCKGEMHGSHLR